MEDVLAVYTRHASRLPAGVPDDLQAVPAETRLPIPMKRGRPARCDYEYERSSAAHIFAMFALEGWRHARSPITIPPWTTLTSWVADRYFANAKTVMPVRTISTSTARGHSTKRFQPPRPGAGRALRMTHSSTVVLADLASPARRPHLPVPDRRIADKQTLIEEIAAWGTTAMPATKAGVILNPQCPYQTQALYPAI
jgi:hypothetical protein